MRIPPLARVLAFSLTLIGLLGNKGCSPPDWITPTGGCELTDSTQVQAVAHGEFADVLPRALATAGTTVELHGVARRFEIVDEERCRVRTKPLRSSWRLFYEPPGGLPTERSDLILRSSHLDTSFLAEAAGTYYAELLSGTRVSRVGIDILVPALDRRFRRWISMGPSASIAPDRVSADTVGKIEALAFDPTSNGNRLYAGSSKGGVWKSENRGRDWVPATDNKGLSSLQIGAVAVDVAGVVYTGGLPVERNYSVATWRPLPGIWRSADAGATWDRVGDSTVGCPQGSDVVLGDSTKRLIAHPRDAGVLYAATRSGLYRSERGGDCWNLLLAFTHEYDIASSPRDPETVYMVSPIEITVPGFAERSKAWRISDTDTTTPTFTRLVLPIVTSPGTDQRVVIAVAPSRADTVYMAFANRSRGYLISSETGGTTWRPESVAPCANCDYNLAIAVSPSNPDRLIYAEVGVWEGVWSASGATWKELNGQGKHADVHAIAFAPDLPEEIYIGTDGGVYQGTLAATPGDPMSAWTTRNFGLATTIGYEIAIAPTNAASAAIGQWDNHRFRWIRGRAWETLFFNEGRGITFDPSSDEKLYATAHEALEETLARHPDGKRLPMTFHLPAGQEITLPALNATANPFRSGEILGQARDGNGPRELYMIRGEETPWRCVQPSPDGASSVRSLDFPDDHSYVVSRDNGAPVTYFSVPDLEGPGLCTRGTDAEGDEIAYTPAGSDSNVRIAVDPFDPTSIFLVDQTAVASVFRLTRSGAGSWSSESLGNASITGRINAIAPDPITGVLWLGTTEGLFEGVRPSGAGAYTWTRNLDVPDVEVYGFAAHRERASDGTGTYGGQLRLSTSGRGAWERIIPRTSRSVSSFAAVYCASCLEGISGSDSGEPGAAEPENREVWIAVRYFYAGEGGGTALVRVVPTIDGSDAGGFLSEVQKVHRGEGTSLHMIRYAGAGAPGSLETDGLRVDLLTNDREQVISSRVVPYQRLWTQEDWVPITVEARTKRPDQSPLPVPVTLDDGSSPTVSGPAPLKVAVPASAEIRVEAPATHGVAPTYYFESWGVSGIPQSTETAFSTTATNGAVLTALYSSRPPLPPQPECASAAAPQCGGTCPTGQICVDEGECTCVVATGPDLVISSLAVEDADGDCDVFLTVENRSAGDDDIDAAAGATSALVEGIAGADRTRTEIALDPLAVGEIRQEVATLAGLPCSLLSVKATIDWQGQVAEREEGNNILHQSFFLSEADEPVATR